MYQRDFSAYYNFKFVNLFQNSSNLAFPPTEKELKEEEQIIT